MDPELKAKLEEIEQKVDAAYRAAHRAQQYLFWTGVITIVLFVVPLIGLVFAIPYFLNATAGTYNSLMTLPTSVLHQTTPTASVLQMLGL